MNTDGTGFNTCKECHKIESFWNHNNTDHKEGEQLEDRRIVGESSCNFGDGTDQRVQSLMFMMICILWSSVPQLETRVVRGSRVGHTAGYTGFFSGFFTVCADELRCVIPSDRLSQPHSETLLHHAWVSINATVDTVSVTKEPKFPFHPPHIFPHTVQLLHVSTSLFENLKLNGFF